MLRRIALLIAFVAVELLLVHFLRTRGWIGTGEVLHLVFAVALFGLPLLVAAIALFLKGRKFSLRAMLVATTSIAIFLGLLLIPMARVRNQRQTAIRLEEEGIMYEVESNQRFYETLGIEFLQTPESELRGEGEIAFWMRPLLDPMLPEYPDQAIRQVRLFQDEQIEPLSLLIDGLPNLEEIQVSPTFGFSPDGLLLAGEKLPPIERLMVQNVVFPKGWGKRMRGVRFLHAIGNFSQPLPNPISDEQLEDLLAIPGLEILSFDGFDINDQNIDLIANDRELTHLTLWRCNISQIGYQLLQESSPELIFQAGPGFFSPVRIWSAILDHDLTHASQSGVKLKFSVRVEFNEPREVWSWQEDTTNGSWVETGSRCRLIDTRQPIKIELSHPALADGATQFEVTNVMRRHALRYRLIEIQPMQSESEPIPTIRLFWGQEPITEIVP